MFAARLMSRVSALSSTSLPCDWTQSWPPLRPPTCSSRPATPPPSPAERSRSSSRGTTSSSTSFGEVGDCNAASSSTTTDKSSKPRVLAAR